LPAVGLIRGKVAGFIQRFPQFISRGEKGFFKRAHRKPCWPWADSPARRRFSRKKNSRSHIPARIEHDSWPRESLSRLVRVASICRISSSAERLRTKDVLITGTPVRPQFIRGSAESARLSLGLDPNRETLLIMGGSQGASAINQLVMRCLGELTHELPNVQFLHLTGANDYEKVSAAYRDAKAKALVRPFLTEMELALNAATVAVSRSGGSSLAEFAAMRLPAILIPYPSATDNHQFHNARAFVEKGAARMLGEERATPQNLKAVIQELMLNPASGGG
jgi:UDP-N-acetylglucosamine--N-acetylmuramyl-(pentapeptide) pyrophosphoryl-undecaprenol N-acetylglucosamine transferase